MSGKLKEKLVSEKENLIKQLDSYKSEDPLADPDQNLSRTVDDSITVSEGHDRIAATRRELMIRLDEVENTIAKIDDGRYGSCEKCGRKISDDRLNALPTAKLCLECGKKI
jgi:RNA polymerase-binding transcription factor DksA